MKYFGTYVGWFAALLVAGQAVAAEPAAGNETLTAPAAAAPARGAGLWRGRLVEFRVVDGWAIVEGDIALGRADELERALAATASPAADGKGFGIDNGASGRWPKGATGAYEVAYRIDVDPDNHVPAAVAAFNAQFAGFIQFVPLTTQGDYVAFTLSLPVGSPSCNSRLGRVGGKQNINGPRTCSTGTLMHEMGHAIGLHHEHSRPDRDQYIDMATSNVVKNERSQFATPLANHQIVTPYDMASIMHYGDFAFSGNALPTMVTMPQGIAIGQRASFSAADVDTVYRMYGAAPTATTVTSDPPGIQLTVDGQLLTTPVTFNWPLNSTHVLDVPQSAQTIAGAPHVFGRWNVDVVGDSAAQRAITIVPGSGSATQPQQSPAVTVYSAHFVQVFAFNLTTSGDTSAARAATSVSVTPAAQPYPGLTGNFFRSNQLVMLDAAVGPGFAFGGWFGHNFTALTAGFGAPSLLVTPYDFQTAPATMTAQGHGATQSIFRIRGRANDGAVDDFDIKIDGNAVGSTPYSSALAKYKAGETHQVEAVTPQLKRAATARYVFTDWDGSPTNSISATVPGAGQPTREITANFAAQYAVSVAPGLACGGTVSIVPPSPDGYYGYGQTISVKATPAAGWNLGQWTGDLAGAVAQQTINVGGEVFATAEFNIVPAPFALTGSSRIIAVVGEPEFDLTLYGTGFTPATRGMINGIVRTPTTYVNANSVRVHVGASDYAEAGEIVAGVVNSSGACSSTRSLSIPVRATGYAWPATTPVIEFYHSGLDHYFITANPDEMSKLDDGTFTGWARTGKSFKVFAAESVALMAEITRTVCRFYGNPSAGLDSHFYSGAKDECDAVKAKFPDAWVFESADVFQTILPDRTTGSCPVGTDPIYRLFNQRADVNHRYTTDPAVRTQMIAKGYVPEGYGPAGVAMCTPT